jgi:uncharacterized iron-regulated protein
MFRDLAARIPNQPRRPQASRFMASCALAMLFLAPVAVSLGETAGPDGEPVGADLPYPPSEKPQPGQIVHVPTGLAMSFDDMMEMVAGARLVYVGETHDNLQAHEVQLRIIRDLDRRFPGRIAIGMEMFRQPQQPVLDRWTRGELDELQFLEATQWQKNWGLDFNYYKGILAFARDRKMDVIALNPSAELQAEVRKSGLGSLPETLRATLPEIGEPDPYEHAVMKAMYGGHLPTEGAFESFFSVQRLWEESMAAAVVDYLKSPRGQGKIVVMLTGAGHVEYGFGVPRKVLRRLPLPYVIIEPMEIEVPPEKQMPGIELPDIPLLPADFIWWVNYEELQTDRPHLGVGIDQRGGRLIVQSVTDGSPAQASGIRVGDEITALGGHPLKDMTSLLYWIGQQVKGATVTVTVRRDGQLLDVPVGF